MNAREKGHQKFRIRNFLRSYHWLHLCGAGTSLALPLATPMATTGTVELEVDAPASAAIAWSSLADFFWVFMFYFFMAGTVLSTFLFFGSGGDKLLLESSSQSLHFAA